MPGESFVLTTLATPLEVVLIAALSWVSMVCASLYRSPWTVRASLLN
jgi:hypothetical protein